ncbi:MAG: alpha-galactosidase [Saprospiraceae bacterium]|nr:alpha-galactosidase [Saprospiraceae bacterium]
MRFIQAILTVNDKAHPLQPNRANTFEEIYADFQLSDEADGKGTRYSVFLHPKQDVTVQRLEIQFELPLSPDARFFANGYQSWSESQLLKVTEGIPRLRSIARRHMGLYGDEHIKGIPRGEGYLHSWTYTFVSRNAVPDQFPEQRSGIFCGSLSERTGFTLFLYDHHRGILTVRKDMDGLALKHSFPALDFWVGEGEEHALFDAYFKACEVPPPTAPPAFGWTSWYNHFTDISEAVLLGNLESFCRTNFSSSEAQPQSVLKDDLDDGNTLRNAELKFGLRYFQIDDGWQTAVGDWLSVKPAFPNGMQDIALKIKAKGLQPGLWLAPFVASAKSELVRRHPDWLLKDPKGRPIKVGWNPYWHGWYYALDFYHDGVREYLTGVFHTVLEKWGFELLKLDFLFAVAIAPPPGKTRGGVMWEAMEFIRHLVGRRRILACGVPLGSCFGLADYCRIGGDVHLAWRHSMLSFLHFRERVDTLASLHSTLSRWQLNGRAFQNDPDVFILRDGNQKLNPDQQQTLLTINALLGNLLFTSDDVGAYSEEQKAELEEALLLRGSQVIRVFELEKDLWKIDFEQAVAHLSGVPQRWSAYCNLTKSLKNLPMANGTWVELRPYETLVLKS